MVVLVLLGAIGCLGPSAVSHVEEAEGGEIATASLAACVKEAV